MLSSDGGSLRHLSDHRQHRTAETGRSPEQACKARSRSGYRPQGSFRRMPIARSGGEPRSTDPGEFRPTRRPLPLWLRTAAPRRTRMRPERRSRKLPARPDGPVPRRRPSSPGTGSGTAAAGLWPPLSSRPSAARSDRRSAAAPGPIRHPARSPSPAGADGRNGPATDVDDERDGQAGNALLAGVIDGGVRRETAPHAAARVEQDRIWASA
jgi:hypothetical protein